MTYSCQRQAQGNCGRQPADHHDPTLRKAVRVAVPDGTMVSEVARRTPALGPVETSNDSRASLTRARVAGTLNLACALPAYPGVAERDANLPIHDNSQTERQAIQAEASPSCHLASESLCPPVA